MKQAAFNSSVIGISSHFLGFVQLACLHILLKRYCHIEERDDWNAIKAVVRALGDAGYLKLMFADLYRGSLARPGLTHATILSEEAA